MLAELCESTIKNAVISFPDLSDAIIHSDRGSQYTSELYRKTLEKFGIRQSMNSAAGRCHDNAKCESLWSRFKVELIYSRRNTEKMPMTEVKSLVWRYFMSYWNNRHICSANNGLPPLLKRKKYYEKIYK
jgi:transposase InsO family protein